MVNLLHVELWSHSTKSMGMQPTGSSPGSKGLSRPGFKYSIMLPLNPQQANKDVLECKRQDPERSVLQSPNYRRHAVHVLDTVVHGGIKKKVRRNSDVQQKFMRAVRLECIYLIG